MKCDPAVLWTLVQQDAEPDESAERVAAHVQRCVTCQRELAAIGGDPNWWSDARQWLAADADDSRQHASIATIPPEDELDAALPPVDLGFLDEPAHPEMLGRIGRYDVEALIGRGGMGVVLRGYDQDLHRTVAIKVLAPEWAASQPARQRFAREAQAAASVAHENVVPIFNVEADATLPYLVMRYIPGMTLQKWVAANEPADPATILRVADQLAEGLSAAHHRGLVHRDIKPGNIMVGNNIDRVWITDFGLARAADSVTLTRTGVIAGTPHYMSPEQARGEPIDHRSDLFSLGCVLYFLATGHPPLDAENTLAVLHRIVSEDAVPLSHHRQDLPPSFVALVEQLLRRRPSQRPANTEAVIEMLREAHQELSEGKTSRPSRLREFRKRPWKWAGSAIVVVAGLYLLLVSIMTPAGPGRTMRYWPPSTDRPVNQVQQQPIDPYTAGAAEHIEQMLQTSLADLSSEMQQIEGELQQLDIQPTSWELSPLPIGKRQWDQQASDVARTLRALEE